MVIYTVGHSTRGINELIMLLKSYGIDTLVDVRRFPGSKRFPHFTRESLEEHLGRNGIRYFWLGALLGGYRKGGYEKYTESDNFREGIKNLSKIAKKATVVIMCAELLWFRCHRRYISEYLTKLGYKVIHIIDENRTYEHRLRKESPELFNSFK